MRYLGIDFGTKYIGIAMSDVDGSFAFPKGVIENNKECQELLQKIVNEEQIDEIVIGDTRSLSGEANIVTKHADRFAEELGRTSGRPIRRAREAWSSQEASRFAPPGERHNDASAAAIILQRFLDLKPTN